MNKINRTLDDLKTILKNQIQFLKNSCESFDNNFEDEAMRIAAVIRVMLHDTSMSKSLLRQLGLKNIQFRDSATAYDPLNLIPTHGLVGIHLGGGAPPRFSVRLGERPYKLVSFDEWWNKIVIADEQKNKFTRKDLILALTNKEGGSHVDPLLDEDWNALTRLFSIGWKYTSAEGTLKSMEGVEKYSMRQIGFEVIESLKGVI